MLGLELHDFQVSKQVLYTAIVFRIIQPPNNLPVQLVSTNDQNKKECESLPCFDPG